MGVDRSEHRTENRPVADESNPVTESNQRDSVPQHDLPTVRIICKPAGKMQLDFSQQSPEYSRRIAQKLVRAKVPSGAWNNYNCRDGTVVQFVSTDGTPLGEQQPLQKFLVSVLTNQNTVHGIFIRDLEGPDGAQIVIPPIAAEAAETDNHTGLSTNAAPSSDSPKSASNVTHAAGPLAVKPLADWGHLKTKTDTEKTGKPAAAKQLPDATSAAADEVSLPSRAAGEPPSWAFDRTKAGTSTFAASTWGVNQTTEQKEEWKWLNPSRAAETQLQDFLEQRNGDLHLKRRQTNELRRQKREPLLEGPTWIDSFFKIAKLKFGTLETPLCHLAEVYVRPDYLSAPHTDKKSATMTVDRVVGLLMSTKKSGKRALQKFAAELLERGKFPDVENVGVAGAARKDLSRLAKKLANPKTSLSDGLQIILQDMGDSIRFEYEQMRKSGNESEKLEIIKKCRGALAQAGKSKAFRNCNSEQREQLNGVINGWGDRLTSYVNTNKLPQPGNRDE